VLSSYHLIHQQRKGKHNYRIEIGERYAYDNAYRQLWQLEGYLLREKIMNNESSAVA
jgi:hypothetical protein